MSLKTSVCLLLVGIRKANQARLTVRDPYEREAKLNNLPQGFVKNCKKVVGMNVLGLDGQYLDRRSLGQQEWYQEKSPT